MKNFVVVKAHLCIFTAGVIWGLMSPIGKDAMMHGVSGLAMVAFRVTGAAILFWLTSLFLPRERVCLHDKGMMALAALFGLVCNQCCFTIGLSLTSPINSSIITTTLPIVTMILAALFLHEPVTSKKVVGIFCGAIGAVMLILGSTAAAGAKTGDLRGDMLCLLAQCSFACYLAIFRNLIRRYSVVTFEKWMFLSACIVIVPLSFSHVTALPWASLSAKTWGETAFVVIGSTYLAYILMMSGQKVLRPTVVSMYNYVQPVVACIVSVATGLGVFGWRQTLAVVLVFSGVYLVTKSKSRRDMEAKAAPDSVTIKEKE